MNRDIKKQSIRRLKIIAGQINGLEKMVDEEKYCVDIITQSSAVKKAISSFEDIILRNHLSTCFAAALNSGQKEKAVKEVLRVYKFSKRL